MSNLTEVQAAILDSLRHVVEKEIAPIAHEIDKTETFSISVCMSDLTRNRPPFRATKSGRR